MAEKKAAAKRAAPKNVGGAAPAASKFKGAKAVSVLGNDGDVIRTYSKEQHGDKFLAHAEEFASKEEGRKVVKAEAADETSEEETDA